MKNNKGRSVETPKVLGVNAFENWSIIKMAEKPPRPDMKCKYILSRIAATGKWVLWRDPFAYDSSYFDYVEDLGEITHVEACNSLKQKAPEMFGWFS